MEAKDLSMVLSFSVEIDISSKMELGVIFEESLQRGGESCTRPGLRNSFCCHVVLLEWSVKCTPFSERIKSPIYLGG